MSEAASILQVAKGLAAGGVITLVGLNGNVVNVTDEGYLSSIDETAQGYLLNETWGLEAIKDAISGGSGVGVDLDTLLARLTSTRAGYLDELDFDLDARIGTPVDTDIVTDIANVKTDVNTVISNLAGTPATGTFTYLVAGGEQDAIEFAKTNVYSILSLHLDLSNFTNGRVITARVYSKIDGSTYQLADTVNYTIGNHNAITIAPQFNLNHNFKISFEIDTVEAGGISVPYRYVLVDHT